MDNKYAGVIGATSFVGECLIALLLEKGWQITAFSREKPKIAENKAFSPDQSWGSSLTWRGREDLFSPGDKKITVWFYLAPVWTLPDHFDCMNTWGVQRIVVLSSTSIFTKGDSGDAGEREMVHRLIDGEAKLRSWAENYGITWTVLRPTLIYGRGRDRNIMEIVRIIKRLGFFPVFGKACGLRQPVYVEDVAQACLAAFLSEKTDNRAYNITGRETLAYREMVKRVFLALDRTPYLLPIPKWIIRPAIRAIRTLPRYRHWTVGMAERMNRDLVFDSSHAVCDFGYEPRSFTLNRNDLL